MKQFINERHPAILVMDGKGSFHYFGILGKMALVIIMLFSYSTISVAQNMSTKKVLKENRDLIRQLRREDRKEERKLNSETVSTQTKDAFSSDFPDSKAVSWSGLDDYSKVEFTSKSNKKMMAYYNFDNELIGSGRFVNYKDLPAKALTDIAIRYKDYTPEKAMFYDNNEATDDLMNFSGVSLDKDAYYVLLQKGTKEIVLQLGEDGTVSFFSDVR